MKEALIIFVRNSQLGKVKTRLAATIGDEKTLMVYNHLLHHTRLVTQNLCVTKFVYYDGYINDNDLWNGYEKKLQRGNNLGEKMKNAFKELFSAGFSTVCIAGSDCYELTDVHITNAFKKLTTADVVIGPASDGGYYLLGSNKLIADFFVNKQWSTSTVYSATVKDAERLNLIVSKLPVLNDIDEENDLRNSPIAYLLDK